MTKFNVRSPDHVAAVAAQVLALAGLPEGVLWSTIMANVSARYTVKNWMHVRAVVQSLPLTRDTDLRVELYRTK